MCLRFLFTPPPPCPVLLFFHLFISVPFLHCPHRPWSIIFSPVLQMLYEACKRSPADYQTSSPHPTCFKSAGQHIRRKHLAIFMLPRSLGGAVSTVCRTGSGCRTGWWKCIITGGVVFDSIRSWTVAEPEATPRSWTCISCHLRYGVCGGRRKTGLLLNVELRPPPPPPLQLRFPGVDT